MLKQRRARLGKSFVTFATSATIACAGPVVAQQMAVAGPVAQQGAAVPGQGVIVVEREQILDPLGILIEQRLAARASSADETTSLLYLMRAHRPIWNDADRAAALLAAVERLDAHGLSTRDFQPERLRSHLALPDEVQARVTRELLLTDTLVAVAKQLRYGKLDPRALYREWNFTPPPNPYEHARELAAVLDGPDLRAALEAQAPSLPLYRALQEALAQQRQLAARGDWPKVPAGPTLRPGQHSARIPALRARLQADGEAGLDVTADARRYDETLRAAVERFQARHGLAADGIVGAQTLRALNTGPAERVAQIRANLERLRWVATDLGGDRLHVDIVGYHADLVLDGQMLWAAPVIVGRPSRKTPSLRDSVVNLVLNPKWVVPPTILREDVIPGMARNPAYLASHRLRLVDRSGQTVDPAAIDWSEARRSGLGYMVVQQSGARGSLGRIKFALSNPYAIYLHDTNARSLFGRAERALSSGCVRVQNPEDLAVLLLDDAQNWSAETLQAALDSGRTRTVPVGRDVRVLLHYSTAALDETGRLLLRNDIYEHDPAIVEALDAAAGVQR